MFSVKDIFHRKTMVCFLAGVLLASSASANLIYDETIGITGTGLGAVNTLATAHDPGGPGNQNNTESGCVSPDGSDPGDSSNFDCLAGLEGGDNTAINKTYLDGSVATSPADLALVVNISETGQDLTATLTDLYMSFYSTSGTLLGTFSFVDGPMDLTAGEGTGTGASGFVFVLDDAQKAQAIALCGAIDCIVGGGFQFANGSTNDGNDTLHLISVTSDVVCPPGSTDPACNPQEIPEPGALPLLAVALLSLGIPAMRRRRR